MLGKITIRKTIKAIFNSPTTGKKVTICKIEVGDDGKPIAVFNKANDRFNFNYIDDASKEKIEAIVERNKKYL